METRLWKAIRGFNEEIDAHPNSIYGRRAKLESSVRAQRFGEGEHLTGLQDQID